MLLESPVLIADCSLEVAPTMKCTGRSSQFGNYTAICDTADEALANCKAAVALGETYSCTLSSGYVSSYTLTGCGEAEYLESSNMYRVTAKF